MKIAISITLKENVININANFLMRNLQCKNVFLVARSAYSAILVEKERDPVIFIIYPNVIIRSVNSVTRVNLKVIASISFVNSHSA